MYLQGASPGTGGTVTLESTIIANNSQGEPEDYYPDVYVGANRLLESRGHNRLTSAEGYTMRTTDHMGAVNYVVTSIEDAIDSGNGTAVLSLREAILAATSGNDEIWLPAWRYNLELFSNSETTGINAAVNDLDVTSNVRVRGAGAGLTVIDAVALNRDSVGSQDRIFHVDGASASLSLSDLTLAGATSFTTGGAMLLNNSATANVDRVAFVGNTAVNVAGGGIRAGAGTTLTVRDSVFTDNTASVGGAIYADGAHLTIGNTVFALNTATATHQNVFKHGSTTFVNQGQNLLDNNQGGYFSTSFGDYIGAVDYVVTGVADSFHHVDNAYSLSVREAIDLANAKTGAQNIWLPSWYFCLTRAGADNSLHDVSIGDLDVLQDLTIIGVDDNETTIDAAIIADNVFQEIGTANLTPDRLTAIDG